MAAAPARAIMAPLSVFSPLPGKTTVSPVCMKASRSATLAATPPDTTAVSRPRPSAARSVVCTRLLTATA